MCCRFPCCSLVPWGLTWTRSRSILTHRCGWLLSSAIWRSVFDYCLLSCCTLYRGPPSLSGVWESNLWLPRDNFTSLCSTYYIVPEYSWFSYSYINGCCRKYCSVLQRYSTHGPICLFFFFFFFYLIITLILYKISKICIINRQVGYHTIL